MERVELIPGLIRSEAEAIAYFAMGVSSEGSLNGRNVAYRLSFAGDVLTGNRLDPAGNSGLSIGTLQVDLGQHPTVARDLTAAYRAWSSEQATQQPIAADDDAGWRELERMLARNGHAIRREGGRGIPQDEKEGLDQFLASDVGISFVHDRDTAQINRLLRPDSVRNRSALHSIAQTSLYTDASDEDRVRLAAVFLKLENQSGRAIYPGLVQRIDRGELDSFDAVKQAIGARKSYIASGMHHTLAGAETYLALRDLSPENPLRQAAERVLDRSLSNPASLTQEGSDELPSHAEYHAVKTMFLQPRTTVPFLQVLDQGGGYAHGRIGRGQTGFFASGNDFVYWDGDGRGHAGVGDAWREVMRDDMRRVNHRDGRVELLERTAQGEQPLLRIDRRAPPRRPGPSAMNDMIDARLHEQVQALGDTLGMSADTARLERVTASLMRATRVDGLRGVRHLAAANGRLVAWDGDPRDPATRWSALSLEDAARTPVEASLEAVPRHAQAGMDAHMHQQHGARLMS